MRRLLSRERTGNLCGGTIRWAAPYARRNWLNRCLSSTVRCRYGASAAGGPAQLRERVSVSRGLLPSSVGTTAGIHGQKPRRALQAAGACCWQVRNGVDCERSQDGDPHGAIARHHGTGALATKAVKRRPDPEGDIPFQIDGPSVTIAYTPRFTAPRLDK